MNSKPNLHFAISIIFLLLLLSSSFSANKRKSFLKWDRTSYNFGKITTFMPKKHVIKFSNPSQKPVTIDSVTSSCECLAVWPSVKTLQPGEDGELHMELNRFNRTGILMFPVAVFTNLGIDTIDITFKLTSSVEVFPPTLDVKNVFSGDTVKATVTIVWKRKEPATMSKAKGGEHILMATVEQVEKSYVLEAVILPKVHRGIFNDKIIVATGSPQWPHIVIPVTGEVIGFLEPSPETLEFGKISSKSKTQKSITLKSKRVGKYNITKVDVKPDMLLTSVSRPKNKDWQVFVTIYPGERPRPFKGIIKLYIDNNEKPEVIIPVKGEIIK